MKILITTSWAVFPSISTGTPRDDKEEWKDYTINLLTLVSAYEADTITIMWGDAGVANWLITPEQLENLDFSKVFYSWSSS